MTSFGDVEYRTVCGFSSTSDTPLYIYYKCIIHKVNNKSIASRGRSIKIIFGVPANDKQKYV